MKEYGDTFLLAPFREFYREVIRLRHMVVTGTWARAAAAVREDGAAEEEEAEARADAWDYFPEVLEEAGQSAGHDFAARGRLTAARESVRPGNSNGNGNGAAAGNDSGNNSQLARADVAGAGDFVLHSLVSLLRRQESYALRFGVDYYRRAQYVMVALADEIFLNTSEWEGHRPWVSNLLESKMFRTHSAGERVFKNLDHMLAKRDPVDRELAAVYLMALSLGFRGKYRGRADRGQLEAYRRQLFHFVFRREPDLDSKARHLFPEAYYHTLREESGRRLPNPRAWVILLCAVVVAYVALTHGIWTKLTGRIFKVNEHIEKTVNDLGGGR